MPKSLRLRLLAWYAVAVLALLPTFAALAVWSVWRTNMRELDNRLSSIATDLGRAVQRDESGRFEVDLSAPAFTEFGIPADYPYYGIWSADHTLIDRSDDFVDASFPGRPDARTRDGKREVIIAGESGAVVLVGHSLDQVRSNAWMVTAALGVAGGGALIVACIGGWLLVVPALRPVGRIAQIAEAMSESNLGLRVDVTSDDELNRVAAALNRAFDRLQAAFERQTRFTADASHELRTPLTVQLTELEWALSRPRTDEEYVNALRVCERAAQRMGTVVEGLLTLARADEGVAEQRRESVDLSHVLREAYAGVRGLADKREVSIRLEGQPAVIHGNPDRLRELASNLMANAIQYGRNGGTVVCTTSLREGWATLTVTDDGPGITSADLPHIFDRFYRANKARSREAGGAGLGLAISKWIAENHGGTIACTSAVDQGTQFIVRLPA